MFPLKRKYDKAEVKTDLKRVGPLGFRFIVPFENVAILRGLYIITIIELQNV
jgi:hypothetical protein